MKALKVFVLGLSFGIAMTAQAQQPANPTQTSIQGNNSSPLYTVTVNVVERTTKAINYRNRSGDTRVDFLGTVLMPDAKGEAEIKSEKGYTSVDVKFEDVAPATRYGPEYLTYVLWAITPEGRAKNMGELVLDGTKGKLDVTTELQAFGLIVTAEPYFAVAQPSDVVVMENIVRKDTVGKIEEIEAKYELLQRGLYTLNVRPSELQPMPLDKKTPLDIYEARNAMRIARWAGADTDAADSFQKAEQLLRQAEASSDRKTMTSTAREAAQTAEDARLIAVKRQADRRVAAEKQAAAARELLAKTQADRAKAQSDEDARLRMQAEADRRLEAERRNRADAANAAAQNQAVIAANEAAAARERSLRDQAAAEQARQAQAAANEQARQASLQAERARQAAFQSEQARQAAALADQTRLAAAKAEQDRLAAAKADQERQTAIQAERARQATAQAEQARQAAAQAAAQSEKDKAELRASLQRQLNLILETRATARGLIVNISDVLFDTDQYALKPGAREKLAKVSGVMISHPGLRLEVEGHTDSVGSDDYNQKLSENRARSVRDFLIQQGIPAASLSSKGLGEAVPVATNDTAEGRQKNRRVELVVSGDVIGIPLTSSVR